MKARPVLIVCGACYVSGKELMALELGEGLAHRGLPVTFITSFWHDGDFAARLKHSSLPSRVLRIGFISATLTKECLRMNLEQTRRWPGLLWGYSRILRLHGPAKVIHTNWHHLLLLLPFLRPDRDLFWVHEHIPDLPQYRLVFRWFERRLGCFVCVSNSVARSLREIGIRDAKIRVIHNGITDPASPVNSPRQPNRSVRIGIVGQVAPWKGHDDLIDALAQVGQRHPTAELHIFGRSDPSYQGSLTRKAIQLGVADRIKWHGFVADRKLIYGTLDICVVPSRSEDPLPTTALDAGFFGTPTVATRCGGLPEVIEHEVNGLLVEAQRPEEIAEALCRLIDHPSLSHYLAVNARQRAVERFGAQRFVQDFQELLRV
jgi:glycosyltransferase involved in cell wall biosynthesis